MRGLVALALLVSASASAQAASEDAWLAGVFRRNDSSAAGPPPQGAPTPLAESLACWDWLRRAPRSEAETLPIVEAARCFGRMPGFPGLADTRRHLERQAADPTRTPDPVARIWFDAVAPETAAGRARLALLLSAEPGRMVVARQMARAAWTGAAIPEPLEAALLARFAGELGPEDHARRFDALVWAGQTTAAARVLPLLSGGARALAEARLALRAGAADAEARWASVPVRFRAHAGLVHDRALWLERRGRLADAEALLATAPIDPATVSAPRTWLEKRLAVARAAWRRGDPRLAERILDRHQSFPSLSDAAAQPLGVRVHLSETEWLAGFLALRVNGRAEAAAAHFTRFLAIVQTPVSRARGDYWLGRAEEARGRRAEARAAFERAATVFDTFYGQLAAEALGRPVSIPALTPPLPTEAERRAVAERATTRAMLLLGRLGEAQRQSPFVRAVALEAASPGERRAAAELGLREGRRDLPVWIWREARAGGDLSVFDLAYPGLPEGVPVPPERWIYAHAVARQESSFDRTAVSVAGARGLMQLMPATAADVAGRLGLAYSPERLWSDPAYNVLLGADYLFLRRAQLGSWPLAAAAYNAGLGHVRRWIAANGDPRGRSTEEMIDWIEAIPIAETRTYVQRVTENAVIYSILEPTRPGASPWPSTWLR
ncbi:transglycosylase SLT domain-containing protein [Thermaurantiacus sp.]